MSSLRAHVALAGVVFARAASLVAVAALAASAIASPALAEEPAPGDEPVQDVETRPVPAAHYGRLSVRAGDAADHPPEIRLEIGERSLRVDGADAAVARRLANRLVRVIGVAEPDGAPVSIRLSGADALAAQERHAIRGTVRARADEQGRPDKDVPFELVAEDAVYAIPRRDAGRFAAFEGLHVEAESYEIRGAGHAELRDVRSVVRRLLPGERDPQNGGEALAGTWEGSVIVERVPGGVPGIEPGDRFGLSLTTDASHETTGGRLIDTYDITGVRVQKFVQKRRTTVLDVSYTFGAGDYTVRLEGTYGPDWKSLSGTWASGFLGSGTFELRWQPAE